VHSILKFSVTLYSFITGLSLILKSLPNSTERGPPWKLVVIVKKYPVLHETRRFMRVLTRARSFLQPLRNFLFIFYQYFCRAH